MAPCCASSNLITASLFRAGRALAPRFAACPLLPLPRELLVAAVAGAHPPLWLCCWVPPFPPLQVDSDPRAAYFRQMEYGVSVRMALLAMILSQA